MTFQIIVFLVTTIITFFYGVWKRKLNKKKDKQFLFKVYGYYLHHSLLGLVLIFLPLLRTNIILFYIGLGIVIGHGFEEIYLGDKNLKTFFIFISK